MSKEGCYTCGRDVVTKLLKRHLRSTVDNKECEVWICQNCSGRLHLGHLAGWERVPEKEPLKFEGKKYNYKKGGGIG
jgi:hypothetical protein